MRQQFAMVDVQAVVSQLAQDLAQWAAKLTAHRPAKVVVLEAAQVVVGEHAKVDHNNGTVQTVDMVVMVVDTDAVGDALDVKAALETAMVAAKGLVSLGAEMAAKMTARLTAIMVAQTVQELVCKLAHKTVLILVKELVQER